VIISGKLAKLVPDFKAKMQQVRFPLRFCPLQTPLGEFTALLQLAVFKGPGREGKENGREGRGGRERESKKCEA